MAAFLCRSVVIVTLGLAALSSAATSLSCMDTWLMSLGVPASDARAYSRTLVNRGATITNLMSTGDEVLSIFNIKPQHRRLITACYTNQRRCRKGDRCPSGHECMPHRGEFACCSRHSGCLRSASTNSPQTPSSPTHQQLKLQKCRHKKELVRAKLRNASAELRNVKKQLRKANEELAFLRKENAKLEESYNKAKEAGHLLFAKWLRNATKGQSATIRNKAMKEMKRQCHRSLEQCNAARASLTKEVGECRAQLGLPVSRCRNRADARGSETFLFEGQSLLSSSGRYRLNVQSSGSLQAVDTWNGRVFWSTEAPRSGSGGYRLVVTRFGNVELQDSSNQTHWRTADRTERTRDVCLVLQNDRSLVLYGACGGTLWSSSSEVNRIPGT